MEVEFYNLFWYWENQTDKIEGNIGRCIGVSNRVVSALCYWVLTETGNIISRTTVQHVTRYESENPKIQHIIRKYHTTIESVIGTYEFM